MNKKAFYGLLISLLLPLLCYLVVKNITKDETVVPRHYIFDSVVTKTVNGKMRHDTAWHRLPEFTLVNHLNKTVGWKDMEGKTVIANFFFTHCPSICVQLTKNMKRLQEDIKNSNRVGSREPNFLQFISFSVDSERDSVPQLKKWADRFQINSSNWWLLTGNREDIYDLSINHMKVGLVDGKGIDTAFLHTDYMVLIDKNRHIRGYYHGLDTAALKQLARDVIFLTLEKDPKRKGLFAGKAGLLTSVFVITLIGIALMFYLLRKTTP